jgi:trehalose utilization protein
MNETAWAEIAEAKQNLQPTPPVGQNIQWYQGGDVRSPRAAQVTGIEGSGRVKVVIFSHGQMPSYQTGVYHVSNVIHKIKENPTTTRCGSWNYCPGTTIPKVHYDYHVEELAKREDNLKRAEEKALQAAAEFEAKKQAATQAYTAAMTIPPVGEPAIAPKRKQAVA